MTKRNVELGFALPPEPRQAVTAKTILHGDADQVTVEFGDGSDALQMSRRDFLRISSVAAATAAVAGSACRNPVEHIEPYVDRPEEIRIGFPTSYATISPMSAVFGSAVVHTRTGRPVGVSANRKQGPYGCIGSAEVASFKDLYDPDRLKRPQRITRVNDTVEHYDVSWTNLDRAIVKTLNDLGPSAKISILQTTSTGLSQTHLIDTIRKSVPNLKQVVYEPFSYSTIRQVHKKAYGEAIIPRYRLEQAKLIVSFGADFLGTWLTPEEFSAQVISRRDPDKPETFNRVVQFEGEMTLTGLNADDRIRTLPSHLPYVAMAVAHGVLAKLGQQSIPDAFSVDAVSQLSGVPAETLNGVIDELVAAKGEAVVLGGGLNSESQDGLALESAVALLNHALEATGKSVAIDRALSHNRGSYGEIEQLVKEMNAGNVDVLLIDRANPVYHLPASLGFTEALKKVKLVISTSDRVDETAAYAHYLATSHHQFESWGDAVSYDGTCSIQQAIIQPLFTTRSFETTLLMWFGQSLATESLGKFLSPGKTPLGNRGGNISTDAGPYYRFIREYWQNEIYPKAKVLVPFDRFFRDVLKQGFIKLPPSAINRTVSFDAGALSEFFPSSLPASKDRSGIAAKELKLIQTVAMGNGSQANNGQLQELPDPVTRTVWTSYVMVSPKTFAEHSLKVGQYIEITVNGEAKRFPVCYAPGLHDDLIAVPLGYGRTRVGDVGNELGENAFAFTKGADGRQFFAALEPEAVQILSHGEKLSRIKGAGVIDLERRTIMSIASLDEYKESKSAGVHKHPPLKDLWERYEYTIKWGMSVDLNRCTGCNACVIACQTENNIPVVGQQGIREGREMHWLRVDRYFLLPDEAKPLQAHPINDPMLQADPEVAFGEFLHEPRAIWQPMFCVQCENAPCENVCPVAATTHSAEGLNMMAYNRCVGTRYCSNNCPYKVRRFNWYNYSVDRSDSFIARFFYPELKTHARLNVKEPLPYGMNPDVTVRSRGVIEKCTFCVQRIRRENWQRKKEGRTEYRDGDILTACEEVCATNAITFGNLVDESSKVAQLHASPRAVSPLEEVGVISSVAFLTRVVNTKHRYNKSHGHGAEPGHVGDDDPGHGSAEHGEEEVHG